MADNNDIPTRDKVSQCIWAAIISMLIMFGLWAANAVAVPSTAKAAPPAAQGDAGCETIRWGFLGTQRRTICDSPRRADGSWQRYRAVWTPAGYVPLSCSYYTCWGGYYREESIQAYEDYPVNDGNVLPDEPRWLPPGTVILRAQISPNTGQGLGKMGGMIY